MDEENQITQGVIWKQLLLFFFPVLFGTFLQQIYNTADSIVVGRFVGTQALAAVSGSVNQIVNMLVDVFVGLTSGAAVIVAQFYGAKDKVNVDRTVHTCYAFCVVTGIAISVIGYILSVSILTAMKTPAELINDSVIYMHIYFLGTLFNLTYNMGASILRATGDSKRPLLILFIACMLNIFLDIILVVYGHLGVMGVAIATVFCQAVSAVIVTVMLKRHLKDCEFKLRKIHFFPASLHSILRVGIPAGFEAAMYCIANAVIQVFVNMLGTRYVAAWGTFGKIDAFFWMLINAFSISITTFVGQNYGAGKTARMRKSVKVCLFMGYLSAFVMIICLMTFAKPMYSLFTSDEEVVNLGVYMLRYLMPSYILYVAIGILSGSLRGAGRVLVPVLLTCCGVCVLRIVWMFTVVPRYPGIDSIMWSYTASWGITSVLFILYYIKRFPRVKKADTE